MKTRITICGRIEQFCPTCPCGGQWWDQEAFFEKKSGRYTSHHSRCDGCVADEKDPKKQKDRAIQKAADVIRHEAVKYTNKCGRKIDTHFLKSEYGLTIDIVAQMFRDAKSKGLCHWCERPFAGMGHEWSDYTFDVINPKIPPIKHNRAIICMTCNRRKGDKPLWLWILEIKCLETKGQT